MNCFYFDTNKTNKTNKTMEEEYREKLVSIALSDTIEPLIEDKSSSGMIWSFCKKPLRYIVKCIQRLVCCFTKKSKKQI